MGNRVTQSGSVATASEDAVMAGTDGQGDPGQNIESPHHDSEAFASNSSNGAGGKIAARETSGMGISVERSTKRILVVDDEAAISDTLALIFQMQHYEVRVAYTAEDAIEIVAAWRPDLAVLDVMLPAMNGIDLALVIKANYADCHVILFSGHANTGMLLDEAERQGHRFEILAKPVEPQLMLERASSLFGRLDETAYN